MNDMIECPELGAGEVGLPGALEVPRSAYDALQRCAAQWPDREGVVFPLVNQRLSFAQWLLQSNRLASALRCLGVGEGDAVALWAENRTEWAVTLTALAGLGAVLVPINTHLRETDLSYVLKHSQAKAILFSRRFRSSEYLEMVESQHRDAPALQHLICFDPIDRPGVLTPHQRQARLSLLPRPPRGPPRALSQRSERWMYRSAGPNWRIQVNSSEYMYLSGKRCNTILKFRTSGTRYSSRRLRVPLVRKHSQFSSLSSVTLFWRQKLN